MMERIKDVYVLTDDIKAIYFQQEEYTSFLVIKYRFEEEVTKIPVDGFNEFYELAEELCDKINMMKA